MLWRGEEDGVVEGMEELKETNECSCSLAKEGVLE